MSTDLSQRGNYAAFAKLDNFQMAAVKQSMSKMLNESGHFSICTIDDCLKVCRLPTNGNQHYHDLHLLHCVSYSEMEPELLAALPAKIAKAFHHNRFEEAQVGDNWIDSMFTPPTSPVTHREDNVTYAEFKEVDETFGGESKPVKEAREKVNALPGPEHYEITEKKGKKSLKFRWPWEVTSE